MRKKIFPIVILCVALATLLCGCSTTKGPRAISGYTIFYENVSGGRLRNATNELNKIVKKQCEGQTCTNYSSAVAMDRIETGGYEIHIGDTGSPEAKVLKSRFKTPMDWSIRIIGTKIFIVGDTSFATAAAVEKFCLLQKTAPETYLADGYEFDCRFDTSYINPLCYDTSTFVPVWADEYTVPDWTSDLYETMYAVAINGGRMSCLSHRGDFVYYPMCSLEGFLSAILAGADVVEIDFRLTKDNIPVLMHDEDLRVCTNVMTMAGKNGLPTSYYIGDWTYEQLQQLNLIMQSDKSVTPYKITTCYEALLVAKQHNALLTWDDKADETKTMVFAATTKTSIDDMLPLMLETDTLEYFLYYYEYFKGMNNDSYWTNLKGTSEKFKTNLAFWRACVKNKTPDGVWSFWNDSRYSAWGYASHLENDDYWNQWFKEGHKQIWTNNIVDLCKYITSNFEPDDYSSIKI